MSVVDDYTAGMSLADLAAREGVDATGLSRRLRRAGVTIRTAQEQRQLNIAAAQVPVEGELSELIDGLMLGDGTIRRRGTHLPTLGMTNAHLGYVEYVADQLRRHGIDPWIGPTGRGHWAVATRAWPALDLIADRWYVGTRKRAVPSDVRLTPVALLHWWLGDGGLSKRKGKRPTGYFYTNSFPEADVRRLADLLRGLGIPASANRCGGPQYHEWRIHLSGPGARTLLELIGPCPVPSYAYKWNAEEVYRCPT